MKTGLARRRLRNMQGDKLPGKSERIADGKSNVVASSGFLDSRERIGDIPVHR